MDVILICKQMVDIIGFPNYTINENGEVYNKRGRLMKRWIDKDGYFRISLRNDGIRKGFAVHRLIYQMYNLKSGETMPVTIDHINGNKSDNSLDNLRGATRSENQRNKGKQITNTSGHKNIYITPNGTFQVYINYIKRYSKTFKTIEEAIADRDIKLLELHGDFANNGA